MSRVIIFWKFGLITPLLVARQDNTVTPMGVVQQVFPCQKHHQMCHILPWQCMWHDYVIWSCQQDWRDQRDYLMQNIFGGINIKIFIKKNRYKNLSYQRHNEFQPYCPTYTLALYFSLLSLILTNSTSLISLTWSHLNGSLPSWSWLRVSDEDISPSNSPNDPPSTMQGPMTIARMWQLNL